MNKQSPLRILIGIAMISSISFIIIGQLVNQGWLAKFDQIIIQFVQSFETPFLTMMFRGFSHIGSGYSVTLITLTLCLIFYFFFHEKRKSILFALTMIITILLNEFIKSIYERPRPTIHRLMDISGYSFPSGHTMMAVSLYAMIVYILWPNLRKHTHRVILISMSFIIACMIALSRIYVGVHYPTDILGGIVCSAAVLTFLLSFDQWIRQLQSSSTKP